jgi:hypothetical protein
LPERLGQPTQTTQATQATQPGRTRDQRPVIPARAEVRPELQPNPAQPNPATILLGQSQGYTATLVIVVGPRQPYARNPDTYTYRQDVTGWTSFAIRPDGACDGATCTPTDSGTHTVIGSFLRWPRWPKQIHGTAFLQVEPVVERLGLEPNPATILLGQSQDYTVQGFAAKNRPVDLAQLTAKPVFLIDQGGTCTGATCTPIKAGDHTVTVTLTQQDRAPVTTSAALHVEPVVASLQLQPNPARILLGSSQNYEIKGLAADGNPIDLDQLTAKPVLGIDQGGTCRQATCTPVKAGRHTVTVTLTQQDRAPVTATAVLHVEPLVQRLELQPNPATILLGQSQDYVVKGFAAKNSPVDLAQLTAKPVLELDQGGTCTGATCTPTKPGRHTVTVSLTQHGRAPVTATAVLHAEPEVKPSTAKISSVTPDFTPPAKPVEVRGNTGSCNRAGTLTFHGTPKEASVNVTGDKHGDFVARFTVPRGTFPISFKLELTVDCNAQVQRAERELTVINLAPVAADDFAVTIQDTPVAIAVTANDRNLDLDTGYQTLVVEHGPPPPNGTILVQPDGVVIYTPRAGFLGQDQFQYGLCDNVINAAGTADCGIATVRVTVNPGTLTTGGGPSGGGPSGGGPSGGKPCAPSAGDLRQHLQVTPAKGPGGAKLRITAMVDRRLAACSLRLLLGGTPLGPNVSVGPDGTISAQLPVPTNAIPGGSTLRLATTGGQILDEASFEVLPTLLRQWWQRDPYRFLLGAAALLAGALARAAIRRLRRRLQEDDQDDGDQPRQHRLRPVPYTRPAQVTVEPASKEGRTVTVRLQPHADAGTLTLQEVPG